MPELPEVETVVRSLRERAPSLLDRTVRDVEVLWPREVQGIMAERFVAQVNGSRVQAIRRHGKNIMIDLAKRGYSGTMFVHLKMSGRLDVVPEAEAHSKHARVIWHLDKGLALRFDDARKFGRVWLPDHPDLILSKLGPDALSVSEPDFIERLLARRGALKPILLDQAFIAGVGNIYADESLHRAKLHPQRIAATLERSDAKRLHKIVQSVLHEGIAANGASFDWVYPDGNFQSNFRVYGQTGKPCANCGNPIERILVGQRSTHFCPHCQRASK